MKLLRVCLAVSILVIGLAAPQAAGAATTKVRTKFVFEEEDSGRWYEGAWVRGYYSPAVWSLDATSVPSRTIRGRLMYYRTSDKKWVPYKYRPIAFDNEGSLRMIKSNFAGNFRVTLDAPRAYSLYYPGSSSSRPCQGWIAREDFAETSCSSSLATESVDASHTKVTVSLDYRYNPYVDRLADIWITNAAGVQVRSTLYIGDDGSISNACRSLYDTDAGAGRTGWSYILPNDELDGQELSVRASVDYDNEWIFGADLEL